MGVWYFASFVRKHPADIIVCVLKSNLLIVSAAGVPDAEIVEAHGSFRRATCLKCKQQYDGNIVEVREKLQSIYIYFEWS